MGGSRWRRAVRHSHRTSRWLVLQTQPQSRTGPEGRHRRSYRPLRAGRTRGDETLPRCSQCGTAAIPGSLPATASSIWWTSRNRRRAFMSVRRTSTGKRFDRSLSLPNLAWNDPQSQVRRSHRRWSRRFLITEDDVFCWYPSLAEDGFGPQNGCGSIGTRKRGRGWSSPTGTFDLSRRPERRWPHRLGAHPQWRSLLLAQPRLRALRRQSHDGQRAMVRQPRPVRSTRIRLADIDGSGTTDIIYLGRDGVRLYFNQSGNSWSKPRRLHHFPQIDTSLVSHRGGSARQRHCLPGLVLALAGRCAPARCATSI